MAGKARRHNTNMGIIGDMDYVSELIDVVASGQNIWQVKTMDTLTQADNTPVNTSLNSEGDNMTGVFGISAWCTSAGSLTQLVASSETLDVGRDKMHSSRWVWVAGSSTVDKLSKIDNAEHDGQLLFIENIDAQTPTIYDESQQTNRGNDAVAGANIRTLDGNNFVFPSNKIIVCLMYSVIDAKWHLVTSGGSSSGVSLSANNTWTGLQKFDGDVNTPDSTMIQIDSSSPQDQSWGSEASGFFYIKDSGGTARKVPYP